MDDEDDRRLLDILGDVDALNDYLHGSNSKSIEEDDVTNAAYGSDGSFFANDTTSSNAGLKDGSSTMDEFGDDSAEAGLQLSGSLSFIEDELGSGTSPGGVDLGGEDQPFDILQKSLMEADITEQTLAQEALLDSQPAPTLVQAPVPFSSQLVSGGYGGGVGVVTTATASFPAGQLLQGMSPLPNGSTQHIQVLGSFGATGSVMTLSNLERTPQIVLRPGVSVAPTGTVTGGQVFAPTQGQVGLPFKNIPLQNIIIQRGPGGTQTLVRPIQPKPLQAGAQTVYSLGLQPTPTTVANVVNANAAAPGGQYAANGSIVVQPPSSDQQQQQMQNQPNVQPGQFLLPGSLALAPSGAVPNGPADQNTVQIVAGQNFTTPAGGQIILNQGIVSGDAERGRAAHSGRAGGDGGGGGGSRDGQSRPSLGEPGAAPAGDANSKLHVSVAASRERHAGSAAGLQTGASGQRPRLENHIAGCSAQLREEAGRPAAHKRRSVSATSETGSRRSPEPRPAPVQVHRRRAGETPPVPRVPGNAARPGRVLTSGRGIRGGRNSGAEPDARHGEQIPAAPHGGGRAFQSVVGNRDDRSDLQPGGAWEPDAGQAHGPRGSRQLPGRLLLRDQVQTLPGNSASSSSAGVRSRSASVGTRLLGAALQDRLPVRVRGPRRGPGFCGETAPHSAGGEQERSGTEAVSDALRTGRRPPARETLQLRGGAPTPTPPPGVPAGRAPAQLASPLRHGLCPGGGGQQHPGMLKERAAPPLVWINQNHHFSVFVVWLLLFLSV